jgi:hypothetical protein
MPVIPAPKILIGIHSVAATPTDPVATLISLGTQAALSPAPKEGWVLGPKSPATHAFVVVVTGGLAWRLDGQPKTATWSPCSGLPWTGANAPKHPTALWQIIPGDETHLWRMATRARELVGTAYDWAEITAAAAVALSILPGFEQLRRLGRSEGFHEAMICTQVARQVLLAGGSGPGDLGGPGSPDSPVRGLKDLFPERLGQVLREAEGKWAARV